MRSRVIAFAGWPVVLSFFLGCDDNSRKRQPDLGEEPPAGKISSWPFSTHLPLVIVDTAGRHIPDEPKIPARITLLRDSPRVISSIDAPVEFEGPIRIEIRGKTSQRFPKKQYSLKLPQAEGLLDFPPATDWILHGPYSDKSLMRNFLAYELSNRLGRYATRAKFVEVLLNETGEKEIQEEHYGGVYLLMERIERGPDRVRIDYDHSEGDDLAFIMKIDKSDAEERLFRTAHGTRVIHVYPDGKSDDVRLGKGEAFMEAFEAALAGADFEDPERGYSRYIEVSSFFDYAIINELFKNIDAYRLSAFFHKDRGGKLHMGPVWDFNLSMGNADYYGGDRPRGWLLDQVPKGEGYPIPFWWKRLMQSKAFRRGLSQRWLELRGGALADASLLGLIDETAASLSKPQERNFERWPILGRYVWPNPSPQARTYQEEIQRLKQWMTRRAAWMDREMAAWR